MVGPDSKPIKTEWTLNGKTGAEATTTITPPGTARVDIQAKLQLAGEYSSWIALISAGKRVVNVPLKITRTTASPTVRVAGATSVTYGGLSGTPILRFTLQETSGVPVSLYAPVLTKLGRKDGDRLLQADYSGVEFSYIKPDGRSEKIVDSLKVGANESVQIQMKVPGLYQPGEFTGVVSISSEDGSLPDQQVTIFLKRPWWVALFFIAAGVFISYWLRRWTKTERPRLIQQRRVLQIEQDLEALGKRLPEEPEQDVLEVLSGRLQKLYDELGLDFTDKADETLKDVNGKLSILPLWSTLRRRLEIINLPALNDLRLTLDRAEQFLRDPQPGDAEPIRTGLNDALSKVDNEVRNDLRAKIANALKQAKSVAAELAPARKDDFNAQVIHALEEADLAAQKQPPEESKTRALINDARKSYARILANDLDEKLGLLKKPDNVDQTEWDTLINSVRSATTAARRATDGSEAVTASDRAYAEYLRLLVHIARADASKLQERADRDTTKYADQIQSLVRARQSLDDALTRLDNLELTAAREAYEAARRTSEEVARALPAAALMQGGQPVRTKRSELVVAASSMTLPNMFDDPRKAAERRGRVWSDLEAIGKKINKRDIVFALIVGVIAVVLGLYLLWVDNLTWGGPKDMIGAVLWGLELCLTMLLLSASNRVLVPS